jgi:hypothetical protein
MHRIAALTSKPIGVGETSCVSKGGNKAQWITDAFNTMSYEFARLTEVSFFLYDKSGEGTWDLNSPDEIQAFKNGIL